jgi:cellulose synthase/poly-beta-1,6-N-acetylglucosamine synthase-like glycosyltransferase
MTVALVTFWLALALLAWVYVGYPVLAAAWGRARPVSVSVEEGARPRLVTVGIAAHNAAANIEGRVANVLAQAVRFEVEVVVASDGSSDATTSLVNEIAGTDGRVRLLDLPRVGQSAAQTAIFEQARGEIVVLTDAETRFQDGCLAALVAPFASNHVGCVTGILRWHYDARSDTAQHEGAYWRYEQLVRGWESRAGWLSAGTGALLAVRRSLYRAAPAHASLDQMLPLYSRAAGATVLVAADAVGVDRGTASVGEQLRSRTRIATQGIEANLRMSIRIPPWRMPGTFLAIWSHKLLRWATPFLVGFAAIAGVALYAGGESRLYLLPAAALVVGLVLALIGYLCARAGRRIPLVGLPVTIAAVNLAFAMGWLNVMLRRRVRAWEPG